MITKMLSVLLLLTAASVQAQTLTYDSSRHKDFAAPHATATAGGSFADGWVDLNGGVYSIAGKSLQVDTADTTGYLRNLALRPACENAGQANVTGTITVPSGVPNPGTASGLVLRYQPDGSFYLFQLSPDTLYAYKISQSRTVTLLGSTAVHRTSADSYSLTGSALNRSGGVTLSAVVVETRTGKTTASLTATDADRPLLPAGRVGVDSWVGSNAGGTMKTAYSRVKFSRLPPTPASKASPKIGFIGDSITSGYNQLGSTITPGVNDAAALTIRKMVRSPGGKLTNDGIPWGVYDKGSSGSSTESWLPGNPDSLEGRAKTAFTAGFGKPDPKTNPVWVFLMLGTNDVRSDNLYAPERHRRNLQAIVDDLVGGGFNVVLNHAPSFVTPTSFNGVTWDTKSLVLLRAYLPEEQAIAASCASRAPGRVILGDAAAFDYFAAHPALFQEYGVYGGLHPNGQGGTEALAGFWANALYQERKKGRQAVPVSP